MQTVIIYLPMYHQERIALRLIQRPHLVRQNTTLQQVIVVMMRQIVMLNLMEKLYHLSLMQVQEMT